MHHESLTDGCEDGQSGAERILPRYLDCPDIQVCFVKDTALLSNNNETKTSTAMLTAAQANHANYACACLSLVILFVRLGVTQRQKRVYDLSFFLVTLSIVLVITRLVIVYFLLQYGTANDAANNPNYFNSHSIGDIKTGTILSLCARILITASSWLQICLLLLFYSQIMHGIKWVENAIKFTWIFTGVTFIAVVLATFLECQPFHNYWQTDPQSHSCARGYIQLCTLSATNIAIDLLLLVISYPILFCKGRSWTQHLRVGILFALGTFCIITAALRLKYVYAYRSGQSARSLWASVQMIVSTFVANVPTIYGSIKVQARKKSEPRVRRESRPEIWGNMDIEATMQLSKPERIQTQDSRDSTRSSRKEWFDHIEDLEPVR